MTGSGYYYTFYDVDGQMSDAEEFEDNVLYEVYRNMQRML